MGIDAQAARVQRCLQNEVRFFGTGAPGSRVLELPGVLAGVVPAAPERSLFNAVVYDSGAELIAAYDTVARAYRDAGVRAWTVWLQPDDRETARALEARGHKLDGQPAGMVVNLAEAQFDPIGPLEVSIDWDFDVIAALNDAAYPLPPACRSVLVAPRARGWKTYAVRGEGRPLAALCAHACGDGLLGISAVATLPEARGQRLASRLLSLALRDARERGFTHSALVASSAGRGVYSRLGYQDAGVREMWELRAPRA